MDNKKIKKVHRESIIIVETVRQIVKIIAGWGLLVDFVVMGYACCAFKPQLFKVTAAIAIVFGFTWALTFLPFHLARAMREHNRLVRERKIKP